MTLLLLALLAADATYPPHEIFGFLLLQKKAAFDATLGKPFHDLWDYAPANYSLEFTADHKLYSIGVSQDEPSAPKKFPGAPLAREFALAVEQADIDGMMRMSSGDLSCAHRVDAVFQKSARTEFTNGGKLLTCGKEAAQAILALGPSLAGTEDQVRLAERHSPLAVTKLPEPCPVKQVVFTWEVDAWRVYEVTLR